MPLPTVSRESRRINGMLRSQNLDDRLDTLLKSDGTVSAHFPKDLRALFSMDGMAVSSP